MLARLLHVIKTYWIVVIIGAVVMGMVLYMSNQNKAIIELEADIKTTNELVADAKKTRSDLDKEFDAKAHRTAIKERTVSAKEVGKEIIAVDNILTAFYKTNEPLPENKEEKEALFAKLEEAKAKNTELTGAKESDHIKTWQLNPEWTLTLESVVTYQDTNHVPVVFSMKTKDGKAAGLIYAIYDVNDHSLNNISHHYTTHGLQDEIDVGGM
ncbi:hypothetical protein JUJ52_03325 [Virgibacillus sp. AGTR]|uniref:hypothetical protein n=1 Tax=Virgibacillus sp. AGTR TaxID=2812055 RepID=UPI001D1672C1|nr:hypothetical protein [Virgibacillus sp. AGTR]MCC2248989.1 hypothetical protein [Virgibacillus sp. AGTR]